MIAEQRYALILQAIEENQSISISDLEKQLNVTRETLRRDIATLDERNLLRQVRGGAVAIGKEESSVSVRSSINPEGKRKIGQLAADMIPDGSTVIIDSGTTTLAVAKQLSKKMGLTVFTNDVLVAMELLSYSHQVHLIGGMLDSDEQSTRGHDAIDMLQRYTADFALIGVGGISEKYGFTDYNRDAAKLRETMINVCNIAILLADHTKFGKVAPVRLGNAFEASFVTTDKLPPLEIRSLFVKKNLDLVH